MSKVNNKTNLETILWNCRVALRGVGSTEKNRDAVISLVFLKFAGDKFEKRRSELKNEHGEVPAFLEKPSFYNAVNVFYLDETSRWSYISDNASANDIAIKLDRAMASIEEINPSLKGTLPQNHFSTLGANNRSLKALIDEVSKISEDRFNEEDLIGRVYEYFLQAYAASGTKDDGEFYTPASLVKLIAELIEPYNGTVYDPCCGSGGMFVQSMKFVDRHNGNRENISILGQESNPDTWRLGKMNLAARGIAHNFGEKNASTFTQDLHKDRKVNYIMANPPFNLKNWRDKNELTDDPRFSGFSAMPPVANANYAWILHMISKLDVNNGIAAFLLSNGALNSTGSEYKIRKELIEKDLVEAIIVLPRDMFYTTDISVTLWIINMNKNSQNDNNRKVRDRRGETLFVDLRRWDSNIEEIVIDKRRRKKKTTLTDDQIVKIKELYTSWKSSDIKSYSDIPELCRSVSLDGEDGIRANDYSLAPSTYIEFVDRDLEIDFEKEMGRIQSEISDLLVTEKESQSMLEEAFKEIGYELK